MLKPLGMDDISRKKQERLRKVEAESFSYSEAIENAALAYADYLKWQQLAVELEEAGWQDDACLGKRKAKAVAEAVVDADIDDELAAGGHAS